MMKDHVLSWLNDEESLVTAQRISQHPNAILSSLSRKGASSLLQSIWEEEPDDEKYHVTVCVMEEEEEEKKKDCTTTNTDIEEGKQDHSDDVGYSYSTTGKFCFVLLYFA
jgi:hypothetical protein